MKNSPVCRSSAWLNWLMGGGTFSLCFNTAFCLCRRMYLGHRTNRLKSRLGWMSWPGNYWRIKLMQKMDGAVSSQMLLQGLIFFFGSAAVNKWLIQSLFAYLHCSRMCKIFYLGFYTASTMLLFHAAPLLSCARLFLGRVLFLGLLTALHYLGHTFSKVSLLSHYFLAQVFK